MQKLTKKWQLILYGMSGMGINMLNLIIGSYLCDALMVEGFSANVENWTYFNITIVVASLWAVFKTIAKVVDGVIDIPLAHFTDTLKTRWGRRKPSILIGFVFTVIFYIAFLIPVSNKEFSLANTIYYGIILCLFYVFYSLTMTSYYATFSEIVEGDQARFKLSNIKTVFDIIYYVAGFALIPLMVGLNINIRLIGFIFLPICLTMLIPLFLIKEKSTLDKDCDLQNNFTIVQSVKVSFTNKSFLIWMIAFSIMQFGIQMFIGGQNVLYSGTMDFTGIKITILNALAFAPVPFALILYKKIVQKKGVIFAYSFSIITYIISMLIFVFCQKTIIGDDTLRFILACLSSLLSSLGTGCIFSVAYSIPSAIAKRDEEINGISHSAMYFALQGLWNGIMTAISTGIVWVNLRAWDNGKYIYLMPLIIIVCCAISLVVAQFVPSDIKLAGKEK